MIDNASNIRLIFFCFLAYNLGLAQLPIGFNDQLFTDDVSSPVGIAFVDTQLIYVWEQDGRVEIFDHGVKTEIPLLDINEEVSGTADHGMLGFALHPDFKQNGLIFLSYVVDPHYLRFYGTTAYDPAKLHTWDATIARVTRYQVDTSTYQNIIPDSRTVLIGDSINNGIPVLAPAHGIGGLDFGTDGTLIIGTGDGTTWVGNHTGGSDYKEFGFDSLGKVLGIIDSTEDFGSLRSQLLQSYSGKLLRIDPLTGAGLSSNPFYDTLQPFSVPSKVWALGLRSPFRIRVKPGSGSSDPRAGKPGIVVIGDVGSNKFEEINVIDGPAQNLGWPLYEGMLPNKGYYDQWTPNPYAPNEMNSSPCDLPFFRFNDLLVPERADHRILAPHPCDSNLTLPKQFVNVHKLPILSYGNTVNNPLKVHLPAFDEQGLASHHILGDNRFSVMGASFDGISSIAGDFYTGTSFPEKYHNQYFHGDFGGWIKHIIFSDESLNSIVAIDSFLTNSSSVVYIKFNPYDQNLYYVVLDYRDRPNLYQVRRISYGDNARPVAIITTDTTYGYSPLKVSISAGKSFDPQNESIDKSWYFDGQFAGQFNDTTLILSSPDINPKNIRLTLVVTDEVGLTDSIDQVISLNNSPPLVHITSLEKESTYQPGKDLMLVNLEAEFRDMEHPNTDLKYYWEIKLKHNDHFHVEFTDTLSFTETNLVPLSSTDFDKHSYIISVRATDPLGLEGHDEVSLTPEMITSSTRVQRDHDLFVYPNPARGRINILVKTKNHDPRYRIVVSDLLGRKLIDEVHLSTKNGILEVGVNQLNPGMYVISIENSRQIIGESKLIIE